MAEGELDEVATAIACYRHGVLAAALRRLQPVGPRREHSLTGMPGVLHDAGYTVTAVVLADPMEAAGVNDRAQLAVAEAELRDRINERWMRRGRDDVGPRADLRGHVGRARARRRAASRGHAPGKTEGGGGSRDRSRLQARRHRSVGEGSVVSLSVADRAEIGASARVGPYCVLEPGARVLDGEVVAPHSVVEADEAVTAEQVPTASASVSVRWSSFPSGAWFS